MRQQRLNLLQPLCIGMALRHVGTVTTQRTFWCALFSPSRLNHYNKTQADLFNLYYTYIGIVNNPNFTFIR